MGGGGVFGDSIGIRPWNAKSIGIVSYDSKARRRRIFFSILALKFNVLLWKIGVA